MPCALKIHVDCESHYSYILRLPRTGGILPELKCMRIINARMPLRIKCTGHILFSNRLFFQLCTQSMAAENYSNVIQNEVEGKNEEERTCNMATDFVAPNPNGWMRQTHTHTHSYAITTFTQSLPNRCWADVFLLLLSIEQTNHKYANCLFWSDLPVVLRWMSCAVHVLGSDSFSDSRFPYRRTQSESILNRNMYARAHVPTDWQLQRKMN